MTNKDILDSANYLMVKSLVVHLDAVNSELLTTVELALVDQMVRHMYLQGVLEQYWADTSDLLGLRMHLDFILKKHEMAVHSVFAWEVA